MQHIYIVRHGQDTDNAAFILNGHRDTNLTDLGRQQAKEVASKLLDKQIDVIYSSPLKRAYETALIIAEQIKVPVTTDQRLIERSFGILTGRPVSEIPFFATKTLQGDKVLYFTEADGSEDFPSTLHRAKEVLSDITSQHPDKNILIVTHGDIGKMIRAAYHNWYWESALMTPYFANTEILELKSENDKIE